MQVLDIVTADRLNPRCRQDARGRTPASQLVTVDQIGTVAAFLASEAAAPQTGCVTFADQCFHITA